MEEATNTNQKTVTIYSTPSCSFCKLAKDYFTEKGVEYTDIDVQADPAKANEMVEKSGQMGVPVIDINGELVIGFDKPRIEELLNAA